MNFRFVDSTTREYKELRMAFCESNDLAVGPSSLIIEEPKYL